MQANIHTDTLQHSRLSIKLHTKTLKFYGKKAFLYLKIHDIEEEST